MGEPFLPACFLCPTKTLTPPPQARIHPPLPNHHPTTQPTKKKQFFVAALRDSDGSIVNYVGVQCKVEEAPIEEELKERVKTINFDEA